MRACIEGQSQVAGSIPLRRMRIRRECRPARGNQYSKGGIRPVSQSSELRGKQSAAETHQDRGLAVELGVPFLSALAAAKADGGEDVKE